MEYKTAWNLASIPPEAIPDELLRRWWASRNGRKKPAVTKGDREFLDKQAAKMRERREKIRSGATLIK